MPETKALSPEVKGLLESVRKQAKDYSDAFVYFEKEKNEFEKLKTVLENKIEDFTSFSEKIKFQIEQTRLKNTDYISKSIDSLENEVLKNIKKYEELSDIASLKKEITNIKIDVLAELTKLKNSADSFTSNVIFELDSVFNKYKSEFSEKIESEIENLNEKLTKNINSIDNKLMNMDKNLRLYKDQTEKKLEDFKFNYESSNNSLKSLVNSLSDYIEKIREETRIFENDVEIKLSGINPNNPPPKTKMTANGKVLASEEEIKFKDLVTYDKYLADTSNLKNDYTLQINLINNYIDSVNELVEKNKMKMNLSIFISICSIIGLLVIFYLIAANIV